MVWERSHIYLKNKRFSPPYKVLSDHLTAGYSLSTGVPGGYPPGIPTAIAEEKPLSQCMSSDNERVLGALPPLLYTITCFLSRRILR